MLLCCCPSEGLLRSVPAEAALLKILVDSAVLSCPDTHTKKQHTYIKHHSVYDHEITQGL